MVKSCIHFLKYSLKWIPRNGIADLADRQNLQSFVIYSQFLSREAVTFYTSSGNLCIKFSWKQVVTEIFHLRQYLLRYPWHFHITRTNNPKFYMEWQKDPDLSKQSWEKKNKAESTMLPDFRQYYQVAVIETDTYWHKNRHIYQQNRIKASEIIPHTYGQLIYGKRIKKEREVAQSCPTLPYPMDCSLPGF